MRSEFLIEWEKQKRAKQYLFWKRHMVVAALGPLFYNKQLLDKARPGLLHREFGKKKIRPNKGKRIKFRRYN